MQVSENEGHADVFMVPSGYREGPQQAELAEKFGGAKLHNVQCTDISFAHPGHFTHQ
jgi:hypothetical protein